MATAGLETARVYEIDGGHRVGRWKNPHTKKWENKRIPKEAPDPGLYFTAWCQERMQGVVPDPEPVAKKSKTIRLLVDRLEKHRLQQPGADPDQVMGTIGCIKLWAKQLVDVPLDEL